MNYETNTLLWNGIYLKVIKNDNAAVYVDDEIRGALKQMNLVGKNVIDGGSNTGVYSIYFSRLIGENGMVHAFDIQEAMVKLSEDNAKMNGAHNIKFYHKALSSESGKFVGFTKIEYESENPSSVGVRTEPGLRGQDHCGNVETIALDDLNIENIGLIKLDLEGHEPEALRGMEKTIKNQKPYLIIELSENYIKHEVPHVIKKIEDMGYETKPLTDCNYCFKPI